MPGEVEVPQAAQLAEAEAVTPKRGRGIRTRKVLKASTRSQVAALSHDPEKMREAILPVVLPPAIEVLATALKDRRWGRVTVHSRWAARTVLELAKLVNAQPQVMLAIFQRIGVRDEDELRRIVAQHREVEAVNPQTMAEAAARVIQGYLKHARPGERARLMSMAFGLTEAGPMPDRPEGP